MSVGVTIVLTLAPWSFPIVAVKGKGDIAIGLAAIASLLMGSITYGLLMGPVRRRMRALRHYRAVPAMVQSHRETAGTDIADAIAIEMPGVPLGVMRLVRIRAIIELGPGKQIPVEGRFQVLSQTRDFPHPGVRFTALVDPERPQSFMPYPLALVAGRIIDDEDGVASE